jgi:hypothetical protein
MSCSATAHSSVVSKKLTCGVNWILVSGMTFSKVSW